MHCITGAVFQFLLAQEAEKQRSMRQNAVRTGDEQEESLLDTAALQSLSVLSGVQPLKILHNPHPPNSRAVHHT